MSERQVIGVRRGERVVFDDPPEMAEYLADKPDKEVWRRYAPLEWHARAHSGMCLWGCYTYAWIVGIELFVQHGENPEAVRWFTLDDLNGVGRTLRDDPIDAWEREIHGDEPMPDLLAR